MKLQVALFACLTIVCTGAGVRADSEQEAKDAFTKGVGLFSNGEYAQAALEFRRANQIKFNWKILYNIGQSEAAAKEYGAALQVFEEYLSRGGDDLPVERRDEVLAEIKRMREMVGYLDIAGPAGATIHVDGIEREKLPLSGPLAVSSGVPHDVAVLQEGETIFLRSVRVSGQQTIKLDAAATEGPSASAPRLAATAPVDGSAGAQDNGIADATAQRGMDSAGGEDNADASSADPQRRLKIAGWVLAGTGAAGLIVGGVTGLLAIHKGSSLKDEWGTSLPDSERDEVDAMNGLADASTISLIAGGVLGATGAVLIILGAKKETAVALQPAVSPDGAGLLLEGRF